MTLSQTNEDKSVSSERYIQVNVWAGNIGHASLAIHSEKGDDYLSFWPAEPYNGSTNPRESTIYTYEEDCDAEAGNGGGIREPEGIYKLVIDNEKANAIYDSIQLIREQMKNKILKYTLVNQFSADEKPTENNNYNCSGIVERVISKNLNIQFGESAEYSHPSRVAETMYNIPQTIIVKHDEDKLGSLPAHTQNQEQTSQFRANL